jgi:hypothetical protein
LGLLLLLGASLVLRFINPNLPFLTDPEAKQLEELRLATGSGSGSSYWIYETCPWVLGCTEQEYEGQSLEPHGHYATKNDCEAAATNEVGGSAPQDWRCVEKQPEPVVGGTAGPGCSPIPSGVGSVADIQARLAGTPYENCFGDKIEKASGVIHVESNGNRAALSGTDRCMPGPQSASVGLFQINLTWHDIGNVKCGSAAFQGHFNTSPNDCRIIDQAKYDQCVAAASDPTNNIIEACKIFKQGGRGMGSNNFGQWGPETRRKCGI